MLFYCHPLASRSSRDSEIHPNSSAHNTSYPQGIVLLVPYLAPFKIMSLPGFDQLTGVCASEIQTRIVNRVRFERRQLKMSQAVFAKKCGIPLRTYKRFELNECDSLGVFIQIATFFDRLTAIGLLFPASTPNVELRTPLAALERLKKRLRGE